MTGNRHRLTTAVILILMPIALLVLYTMLALNFEYPSILRQPTQYVLERFAAGGPFLAGTWYAFALAAAMLVPIAVMLHSFLSRDDTPYMATATAIGVVAGVVQVLGLIRWPLLVPYLATTYFDPAASQSVRDAAAVVFQALNHYAGVGIGENLGYLFTSVWTLLAALAMVKSQWFRAWLGWLGVVPAVAIFIGIFEPLGFLEASYFAMVGYILWAAWLILAGLFLLRLRPSVAQPRAEQSPVQPAVPAAPARAPRPAGGMKKGRSQGRRR